MKRVIPGIVAPCLIVATAALVQGQSVYPTGTTIWTQGSTHDGYTLFGGGDGTAHLIDMDGTVVNEWTSPIPGYLLSSVEPLDNGHILATTHPAGFSSQKNLILGELDYNGNVVWAYAIPPINSAVMHHDHERLDNGNTLILCSQVITVPSISPLPLVDDLIIEVDPAGNIVWWWFTWENFNVFEFSDEAKDLISQKGGDWAHANTLTVIPPNSHTDPAFAEGNIILSYRTINTICIVDKTSKEIVWRLGPEDHETYGQHYPHMIEQGLTGAGNILVFDNGSGTGHPLRKTPAPGYSQVKEFDPVTKAEVWQYDHGDSGKTRFSFFANIVSGAERMPNGNTVICSGAIGRMFEIDPNNTIVWEYMSPFAGVSQGSERLVVFRAYRLPYTWAPGP